MLCLAENRKSFSQNSKILSLHHISRIATLIIMKKKNSKKNLRILKKKFLYQPVGSVSVRVKKDAVDGSPIPSTCAGPYFCRNSGGISSAIGSPFSILRPSKRKFGFSFWIVATKLDRKRGRA